MKIFVWKWKTCVPALICKKFLLFLLCFYHLVFAVHVGGACRFYPSCSAYARQALLSCDLKTALMLIIKRLMRCQFFASFGLDFVPTSKKAKVKSYGK